MKKAFTMRQSIGTSYLLPGASTTVRSKPRLSFDVSDLGNRAESSKEKIKILSIKGKNDLQPVASEMEHLYHL